MKGMMSSHAALDTEELVMMGGDFVGLLASEFIVARCIRRLTEFMIVGTIVLL